MKGPTVKGRSIALAALVLVAGVGPLVAAGDATDARSYSGTHVSFEAEGEAVTDYSVDGDTVATAVRVQSESEVEAGLGVGVSGDLSAVTEFAGAALSIEASTRANATVRAESGATLRAHDYDHGTLVVSANGESQYVSMGLNASSETRVRSDQRVVVTAEDGTRASVFVAGDGEVAVNDDGNLTAEVGSESRLVVRAYENRSEADRHEERLILEGTAAAEVYVDEQGGGTVAGTVTYDANTSASVEGSTEGRVEATVERSEHEGKVVIASTSGMSVESETDVEVRVDGEAAARASSYGELRAAADGGATSKYLVRGSAEADAEATVLVAVNHFSERHLTITEAGSGDTDGSAEDGSDGTDANGGADDGADDGDGGSASTTPDSDANAGESDGNDGSGDAPAANDGTTDSDGGGTGAAGPGFGIAAIISAILGLFGLATLREESGER